MATLDLKTLFLQYPKDYVGKESFEEFVLTFLDLTRIKESRKKFYLIKRNELQERFTKFCMDCQLPVASNVNIGRHLGHIDIKCDTKRGPAGGQERFYSGISWVEGAGFSRAKQSLVRNSPKRDTKKPSQRKKNNGKRRRPKEVTQIAIMKVMVVDADPTDVKSVAETQPLVYYRSPTPERDAVQLFNEGLELLHSLKASYPQSFFPEDYLQFVHPSSCY